MSPCAKKYVLIIPDGAADIYRVLGRSPLAIARTYYSDLIAQEGVCGLMQTLYPELPKESLVAQMGMLSWDPRLYYPGGRASCELLALKDVHLREGDLAFRANLVRMEGRVLTSYNSNYISSEQAEPLIQKINLRLQKKFPEFELYHNGDFRNTLVVRDAGIDPALLMCPEPHESHGRAFDIESLVSAEDAKCAEVAGRINQYLLNAAQVLLHDPANMVFPWSPSTILRLPPFSEVSGFQGRVGMVGYMDFLQGIARAGGLDFFKVGNGRPDTDYRAKGATIIELLLSGYEFVVCHINGPDEAAHMQDLEMKIRSIEEIDQHVVRPVFEYFRGNIDELGGIMIVPDHYTNNFGGSDPIRRKEAHSAHPVPFVLWNGRDRDEVVFYSEDDVLNGRYGKNPISHLHLLDLLGLRQSSAQITA